MNQINRRSIRLKNWDYSNYGYYFITICTQNMGLFFGQIENSQVVLNQLGTIVKDEWLNISNNNTNIKLDEFIIMPNHIHGIVVIHKNKNCPVIVGAGLAPALPTRAPADNLIGQGFTGQGQALPLRWEISLGRINQYVLKNGVIIFIRTILILITLY